jgi:hypothetical protein
VSRLSHLLTLEPPPESLKRKQVFSNPDLRRYKVHRTNAKQRGIAFEISYDDWLRWWKDSGHYHERGNKRGQYVMARIGDVGPYRIGNIVCLQAQVNSVAAHIGKTRSDEIKANMSEAAKEMWKKRRAKS